MLLLSSYRLAKLRSTGICNLESKVFTLSDTNPEKDSPNSDNYSSSNLSFQSKDQKEEYETEEEFEDEEEEEKTEYSETKNPNSENSDSKWFLAKPFVLRTLLRIFAIIGVYFIIEELHVTINSDSSGFSRGLHFAINNISLKEIQYFKKKNTALETSIKQYREILEMNSRIVESGTPPHTPLEIIESMNEEAEFFIEDSKDQINKNLQKIHKIETKMFRKRKVAVKWIKVIINLTSTLAYYYVVSCKMD